MQICSGSTSSILSPVLSPISALLITIIWGEYDVILGRTGLDLDIRKDLKILVVRGLIGRNYIVKFPAKLEQKPFLLVELK